MWLPTKYRKVFIQVLFSQLILDRIYKGVQDKVANGGIIKKILFNFAFAYKLAWSKRGFDTPLINKIVFGQTRAMLGGRLRLVLINLFSIMGGSTDPHLKAVHPHPHHLPTNLKPCPKRRSLNR